MWASADRWARRKLAPVDILIFLYVFAVLAFPSRIVVGGAGALGAPITLLALMLGISWFVVTVSCDTLTSRPVSLTMLGWVALSAASVGASYFTTSSVDAVRESERTLIIVTIALGAALRIALSLDDDEAFERTIDVLTVGGAVAAAIAIIQFASGVNIANLWTVVPGLSANGELAETTQRLALNRPNGPALHAIELGVVLGMLLPVVMAHARNGRALAERGVRWASLAVTSAGVVVSLSRAALVVSLLSLLLATLLGPRREAFRIAVGSAVSVVLLFLAQPRLFEAITLMFVDLDNDLSIRGRTHDFDFVTQTVLQRPWWGRGFGSFQPGIGSPTLDNQYFETFIESGVMGVLAVLALFAVAVLAAAKAARWATTTDDQRMAASIAGGIGAGAVALAFFDGFSFLMFTSTVFVLAALAESRWRVAASSIERNRSTASPPPSRMSG